MSLFLGKIHFWLFNKILWFEGLEDEVIKVAKEEGLDTEKLNQELNIKYGKKLNNKKLEEIIDTNNIHGWLQGRINLSEGRMAAWTSNILSNNLNSLSKLEDVYSRQGIKAARATKYNKNVETAKDIYQNMNDYILDGMPCDRINQISILEDNLVSWSRKACVHKDIWDNENIDVNVFYNLRSFWIKSFVNELNNKFIYIEDNEVYTIEER